MVLTRSILTLGTLLALTAATVANDHWAFRPVQDPRPPEVAASSPIDAFINHTLHLQNLPTAPPADRHTLLRRLSFDLTGLPPSVEEVTAFQQDSSPDAWEQRVDRYLASPHLGERWGRHWLDVARYADSKGYVFQEDRNFPYAYTYRDYVIESFNSDRPYDEFVIHQLAADRLDLGDDPTPLAAMAYLTIGRRFLNNTHDIIDDRIDVVTRGLMGLTVSCARCHDHKFDPVPIEDYYALYGVFASSTEPKELPIIAPPEQTEAYARYAAELSRLQGDVEKYQRERHGAILAEHRKPEKVTEYLVAVRDIGTRNSRNFIRERGLIPALFNRYRQSTEKLGPIPADAEELKTFVAGEPVQKWLAADDSPLNIPIDQAESLFNRADRNRYRELVRKVDGLKASSDAAPPRAMVMVDQEKPITPQVFLRGNPGTRGERVPRRFVSVVAGSEPQPFTQGSGRLELAQAITDPNNPLTARVLVNRVWGHHFGGHIVGTPSDFGTQGDTPTHPELLDHLASRFVQGGWSIKQLHRDILTSDVYQRATDSRYGDVENRYLARQNRHRLEWEPLRDSLLAVAGRLDRTIGGRSVELFKAPYPTRRALYGRVDRQNLPGELRAFDFAGPDQHCPRRFETTVPQQALYLLNDDFVMEQAKALAARPEVMDAPNAVEKIRVMYRLALAREPDDEEIRLGQAFIRSGDVAGGGMSGWARYAQVLLLSNEFAFAD